MLNAETVRRFGLPVAQREEAKQKRTQALLTTCSSRHIAGIRPVICTICAVRGACRGGVS